jgi:hypothetical protein
MSDFKTVLVKDSVIGDITSDIDFAVKSGASQTTYQRFPSTSSSNSAVIFNVQVPSENVVIGRDVLINTGLTFRIFAGSATVAANQVPVGELALDYGLTDALHCFPFASLLTTATAQINNTTVSVNLQDVLPSLLRMNDSRELYRFNSTTPSLPDQAYGAYANAVNANNNPLASYGTASYDVDQVPRGAYPVNITVQHFNPAGALYPAPQATSLVSANVADTWVITVSTQVTEPLFLSPFIFGNPEFNCQGLLGINNMALTLNVDATCKRLWSTANPYITNISLGSAANPNGFTSATAIGLVGQQPSQPVLLFKFLSTQPSDLIETKNIVPYMDYPRYLTSSANQSPIASLASSTIVSSNLQINQIPDLFIISIRKPMSTQTWYDADAFFTINNISINLNNQSGLLSSASQYDLWRMSVKNGSTQSYLEFGGQAETRIANVPTVVPTTGSLLVINPAYDLSLPDYISCGSLGNYNFQFQCNVSNQFGQTITPEICIICVNSGIFTTQQGVSAVYTGILTKEMVLAAKSSGKASAMMSAEVARMTGGAMLNRGLTTLGRMAMKHAMRRAAASPSVGGATSGGATSGGRLKKMC